MAQSSPMDIIFAPSMLVARPEVKKDLKLSKDQSKRLDEVAKRLQKAQKELTRDATGYSSRIAELKACDAAVLEILDDAQDQRLRELGYQARGPGSVLQPEVVKALELTDDQVAACKAARSEAQATAIQEMRNARGSVNGLDKIDAKFMAAIQAALKPGQWTSFQAIFGKPLPNMRMRGMYF